MSKFPGPTFENLVRTYIHAKDENRPHLLAQVFTPEAVLEMNVKTTTISFPQMSKGLAAITDLLGREFCRTYENVYTFCLNRPGPAVVENHFSCDWIVGMSEKESGNVLVGCGRYDWFRSGKPGLIDHLQIRIKAMQVLPRDCLKPVLDWLVAIPYPWCTANVITRTAPDIDALEPVMKYFNRNNVRV